MKNKKSNFFQNFIFLNLVLILSIFLYSCSSAKSQDKKLKKTYLQNMNLKGKVKSVRIIYYEAIDKFGELQKGKKESTFDESRFVRENYECNYKIIFNDKGNMIEENWYNSDGGIDWKSIHKYDDKGNMIENNWYNSNSSFDWKHIYKYDGKGNMVEKNEYKSDGIINNKYTYNEYDKFDNWVKRIDYKNEIPQFIVEREIEYY